MRASERLLALMLGLALAAPAHADFKQSYARGKEAAEAGRWAEVEARMRDAMAEQAQPQERVRIYGMRFEPYVPQFYLGLAAWRQGNCAEAQRNWQHAATASIVSGDAALKGVVDQGLSDCRRKAGNVLAQQTPGSSTAPVTTSPPPASTAPAVPDAQRPATPPPSTPQAVAAVPPQRTVTTAPPPRTAPTPTPTTTAPVAAQSAPPTALVAAVDAFLAGRFEQSASLDLAAFGDPRARFHVLLLRSAARHTLSQGGGDRAEALLASAQADIRAAKALAGGQQPDPALFSPRFRSLYEATR